MSSKSLDMARDLLNSWISVWKHGLFTVLCTKALLQYSQKAVQKYVKTWILKLEIATCGTKRNVIVGLALPVCVRNVRPAEERDSNWAIKSWRLNICKGKTTPWGCQPLGLNISHLLVTCRKRGPRALSGHVETCRSSTFHWPNVVKITPRLISQIFLFNRLNEQQRKSFSFSRIGLDSWTRVLETKEGS